MSLTHCRTIELNGLAVALLLANQPEEATKLLRQGLKIHLNEIVRKGKLETSTAADYPSSHERHPTVKWSPFNQEVPKLVTTVKISEMDSVSTVSGEHIFLFFNRAFTIDLSATEGVNPETYKYLTTAVLLYNMALSYHERGCQTGESKLLDRALYFYDLAFKTVHENLRRCEHCEFGRFILLATANNLGHIYSQQYDLKRTRDCRDLLPELLSRVSLETTVMDEEEYVFFFIAMYYFQDVEVIVAAAA